MLARKTTRRKDRDGNNIWTAPVIVTIQDQQTRWELEETLRKSKIHPTFHWPKEFLDPLKMLKDEVKRGGIKDDTHYVRIRPVMIEGKWRIRADTKPKDGQGRFTHAATWEVPPIDESNRNEAGSWWRPLSASWAQVVRGTIPAGDRSGGTGGAGGPSGSNPPSGRPSGATASEEMEL